MHLAYYASYFAFLIAISQDLKAVCCDGKEFYIGFVQQCHHLL